VGFTPPAAKAEIVLFQSKKADLRRLSRSFCAPGRMNLELRFSAERAHAVPNHSEGTFRSVVCFSLRDRRFAA